MNSTYLDAEKKCIGKTTKVSKVLENQFVFTQTLCRKRYLFAFEI